MADEKKPVERLSALLKDLVSTLRDGILVLLVVLLLIFPSTIKNRLIEAGFTRGNIAGLEWEGIEDTKKVGQAVSQADNNYQELIDRLAQLEKQVIDPEVKESLNDLASEARITQATLNVADKTIKRSLSAQQAMAETSESRAITEGGWLYLGKVNESKDEWAPGSPVTIAPTSAALQTGTKVTVTDDAYWRGDSEPGKHASAPILSVAKVGTVISIDEIDYSHARSGGWFVWVRAHRES
jgi:hypothetical protein